MKKSGLHLKILLNNYKTEIMMKLVLIENEYTIVVPLFFQIICGPRDKIVVIKNIFYFSTERYVVGTQKPVSMRPKQMLKWMDKTKMS